MSLLKRSVDGFCFTEAMLEGRYGLFMGGEDSLTGALEDVLEGFSFGFTSETAF